MHHVEILSTFASTTLKPAAADNGIKAKVPADPAFHDLLRCSSLAPFRKPEQQLEPARDPLLEALDMDSRHASSPPSQPTDSVRSLYHPAAALPTLPHEPNSALDATVEPQR